MQKVASAFFCATVYTLAACALSTPNKFELVAACYVISSMLRKLASDWLLKQNTSFDWSLASHSDKQPFDWVGYLSGAEPACRIFDEATLPTSLFPSNALTSKRCPNVRMLQDE
jgi:hypothetical protein